MLYQAHVTLLNPCRWMQTGFRCLVQDVFTRLRSTAEALGAALGAGMGGCLLMASAWGCTTCLHGGSPCSGDERTHPGLSKLLWTEAFVAVAQLICLCASVGLAQHPRHASPVVPQHSLLTSASHHL